MNQALALVSASEVPAHLIARGAVGNENVTADQLQTPRLSLLQSLSPEVTRGKPEFMADAKTGQFLNRLTRELSESLFVSNLFTDVNFVAFKKRQFGQKDFQGSFPTEEAAKQHLLDKKLNVNDYDIDEVHTHTLALIDAVTGQIITPIVYNLSKSALSSSRNWNSQILAKGGNIPRYSMIWKMSSELKSNNQGSWYNPMVELAGYAPEGMAALLDDMFTELRAKGRTQVTDKDVN